MSSERRQWPRTQVSSETKLILNDAVWSGSSFNICMGGLYFIFDDTVSVSDHQQIQLALETEAGVFTLTGHISAKRPQIAEAGSPSFVGLAIEFAPLDSVRRQFLESLLDGVRRAGVGLKVTGLLASPRVSDLLLIAGSCDLTTSGAGKATGQERRLVPRVSVKMGATVRHSSQPTSHESIEADVLELSATGISLQYAGKPVVLGDCLNLRLFPESEPTQAEGYSLAARVVWVGAPQPSWALSCRIGLQFLMTSNQSQQYLAQLVQETITIQEMCETPAVAITSATVEFRNELGQRIAAYLDRSNELLQDDPVVIIVPGYGETKKEYIALAYYLACNGFQVLRYDHTNHVGESEGDHTSSTLGRMHDDLAATLDYVQQQWPHSPVVVIGASLAGRVALKVAAHDRRLSLLVLIAGVVDVRQTLLAVHQEDLIGDFIRGVRRGVINMLGFNIQADQWLENATAAGYTDLATTIRDVEGIQVPLVLFAAEHDAWVDLTSVTEVSKTIGPELGQIVMVPEALHRLAENPRQSRLSFREIVGVCLTRLYGQVPTEGLREPAVGQIGQQIRLERERRRAQNRMELTANVEFWEKYLSRFHFIVNVRDYWQLLDHIYRFLELGETSIRMLDAGCGNGHFGMFMLVNQRYRARHSTPQDDCTVPLIRYTGLDFVPAALEQAQRALQDVSAQIGEIPAEGLLNTSFLCGDLNKRLPFSDEQFDRVACNLVLGYLDNASFTIREFLRVLRPGGKLILTNLKPNSDLSQIYRNFVKTAKDPEKLNEARELLNNSAHIRQGESDGQFQFFDRQQLAMLLLSEGAENVRISTTFANQAFIAVADKSASLVSSAGVVKEEPIMVSAA